VTFRSGGKDPIRARPVRGHRIGTKGSGAALQQCRDDNFRAGTTRVRKH